MTTPSARSGLGAPPRPGVHGGDADAIAAYLGIDASAVLDLSASLNPVAPPVDEVVRNSLDNVSRYPDETPARSALAEAIGVELGRLVLTNGAAEAIALVAQIEPVGWVEEPEFALYARHLRRLDPTAPRWQSNPSNPLGRLAATDEVAGVWDEAFWPLATGTWTRGDDETWRVGSLTKLWACPGLRSGYVIAPDAEVAAELAELRPRWSVNGLALAVVEALLPQTDLGAYARAVAVRRGELATELRGRGLRVIDTESCWLLVEHHDLRSLLIPQGVVVRDCSSFGLEGLTRIGLPDDAGMERLLDALDRSLS